MNAMSTKIPRAIISPHEYEYRATPGNLLVDVLQGDPAAAIITNRTTETVRLTLLGNLAQPLQVLRRRLLVGNIDAPEKFQIVVERFDRGLHFRIDLMQSIGCVAL